MIRHRWIDRICVVVCILAMLLTVLFMNGEAVGIVKAEAQSLYADRLFDDSQVHTIDIVIDEADWQAILDNPTAKEYQTCNVVIDGESYRNVAIRTKGNTSLSSVAQSDSDRYSFKIEFDHYDSGLSYYGLDKLALNNIYQDSTYLKDYLSYHMMNEMGVAAPLSSFAFITINGEDFGLYLAVEAIEESFIERTQGSLGGNLYKPDGMDMGGGGGGFGFDGSASLAYTDDDLSSYQTIWDGAVFEYTEADQERLIESLRKLNAGEDLESAVDVDAVLRYFVVHNYLVSFDSYTGTMLHNYYLYEEDGILSMIPWDYNLAFGTFGGMGGPSSSQSGSNHSEATSMVNYPIDTPVSGTTLEDRPMLGKLLEVEAYLELYHSYFDTFIADYFESGQFESELDRVTALISDYVQKDPTAFYSYEEFTQGVETLRTFCLLRAESIRGQLDGTIPSTSEGQAADPGSLIDAGDLSLSDMGSMGGGAGGGQGGRGGRRSESETNQNAGTSTDSSVEMTALALQSSAGEMPDGMTPPDGTAQPNGMPPSDGMTPPDSISPQGDAGDNQPAGENSASSSDTSTSGESDSSDSSSGSSDSTVPDENTAPGEEWGDFPGEIPQGGFPGGGDFGGGRPGDFTAGQGNTDGWIYTAILLGASVLVLALGLLFVRRYGRL